MNEITPVNNTIPNKSANLQAPGLTIKQIATLMNVSERLIYMARTVRRLRPDLGDEITAGKMSVHAAWIIATGKTKPTSWDRLVAAWNNANESDKSRFIVCLQPTGDTNDDQL